MRKEKENTGSCEDKKKNNWRKYCSSAICGPAFEVMSSLQWGEREMESFYVDVKRYICIDI